MLNAPAIPILMELTVNIILLAAQIPSAWTKEHAFRKPIHINVSVEVSMVVITAKMVQLHPASSKQIALQNPIQATNIAFRNR